MGESREGGWCKARMIEKENVTADSNLISFGRLCRSAIDDHRPSTNTGQCAIGTAGQFGVGGNTRPQDAVDPGTKGIPVGVLRRGRVQNRARHADRHCAGRIQ